MKIDILIALHIRVYIRGYLRLFYIMAKLGGYFKLWLDNEPARLGPARYPNFEPARLGSLTERAKNLAHLVSARELARLARELKHGSHAEMEATQGDKARDAQPLPCSADEDSMVLSAIALRACLLLDSMLGGGGCCISSPSMVG